MNQTDILVYEINPTVFYIFPNGEECKVRLLYIEKELIKVFAVKKDNSV